MNFTFQFVITALWLLFAATAPPLSAAEKSASLPRTILFLDDEDVLYRSGTVRHVVPFKKHSGNPVLAPDRPWESEAIGWNSQQRDPKTGRLQMWYQAYTQRDGDKRLKSTVCYAESEDGIVWRKPNLGLFAFYEETNTNIVLVGSGGYGDRYCNSVLIDERDPDPARRYKMIFSDWATGAQAAQGIGLYAAFSPDGIHWTKQEPRIAALFTGSKGVQPPLRGEAIYVEQPQKNGTVRRSWRWPLTMSDAVDLIWDPRRECYAMYGKMWINGPDGGMAWKHGMGRIESRDFRQWTKPELVLTPNDRDQPLVEFHTSPVFFHQGHYFSLNQLLDRQAGTIDLELMSSRDGNRWVRDFTDTPVIPRGEGAVFDAGSLFSNATPIIFGDEIRFYYGAYRGTAIGGVATWPARQVIGSTDYVSGVGFASTLRDRFVGVRPDPRSFVKMPKKGAAPVANTVGQITLRPLDFRGAQAITLNADARGGGVRVEILDEDGYRLPGFTRDEAVPVTGDGLAQSIVWKDKTLRDLTPARYLVRIHLDRAEVFALTLR